MRFSVGEDFFCILQPMNGQVTPEGRSDGQGAVIHHHMRIMEVIVGDPLGLAAQHQHQAGHLFTGKAEIIGSGNPSVIVYDEGHGKVLQVGVHGPCHLRIIHDCRNIYGELQLGLRVTGGSIRIHEFPDAVQDLLVDLRVIAAHGSHDPAVSGMML